MSESENTDNELSGGEESGCDEELSVQSDPVETSTPSTSTSTPIVSKKPNFLLVDHFKAGADGKASCNHCKKKISHKHNSTTTSNLLKHSPLSELGSLNL